MTNRNLSNGILGNSTLTVLRARWYQRVGPGRLDQLRDVLLNHLVDLERWRADAMAGGIEYSPDRTSELKTRLKELADVHRELFEFLPGPALDPPPAQRK